MLYNIAIDNFHPVVPGLVYRSAQPSNKDLSEYVAKYHIRSVLNLRGENPNSSWYEKEIQKSSDENLIHYDLRLGSKSLPTAQQLQDLVLILETAPKPILVHCWSGADRSGLTAAFAVILSGDPSLEHAEDQITWRYNVLSPSTTGYQVLENYYIWLKVNHFKHSRENFLLWIDTLKTLIPYYGWFLT